MRHSSLLSLIIVAVIVLLFAIPANAQLSQDEVKAIEQAVPMKSTVQPRQPRTLLVFNLSEGFQHTAIERASKALEVMGRKTGAFQTVMSKDRTIFRPENLQRFDAVCFNNTTQLKFDDPLLRKSLLDFIASGKGIVGLHAATDNFPTWPEAQELFGGVFDSHPWTADGTWGVKIVDPTHPLNAAFQGKDFLIKDEIYRIRQINLRKNSRVLLSLDMKLDRNRKASGVKKSDRDIPISWVRMSGKGRLFYCSLGHNNEVLAIPAVLQHYLDGIQFALGDYDINTSPVPFDPMSFFDEALLKSYLSKLSTYQYGDSRATMAELDEFLRDVNDVPEARVKIEQLFLECLEGAASSGGKQFIFQKLALMGSESSIPRLIPMLSDDKTANMALFVLESIEGSKAEQVLLQALPTAKASTMVGIINALRNRRVQSATSALQRLVAHEDTVVASAVVSALGNIGTPEALTILETLKRGVKSQLHPHLLDALLVCASHLSETGNKDRALAVYRELNVPGEPVPVRSAALRGIIHADPANASELIVNTLKSKEVDLHPAVVQFVREISSIEQVRTIARTYQGLPPACQAQLVASLSNHRDAELQKIVTSAVSSKDQHVRSAALRSLGNMGDATVVPLLARAAASSKGAEQKDARNSLNELNAQGTEEALLQLIKAGDSKVKVEVIKSMGERKMSSAIPALLKTSKDPAVAVRLESAKVLKVLGTADEIPAMMEFLALAKDDAERREFELSLVAIAKRIPAPALEDEAILAAYPSIKKQAVIISFVNVLGKIGAPASLPVLTTALNHKNGEIRLSAIRALSEWPSSEPYADLWKIATTAKVITEKTLALRGAVRLIGLDTKQSANDATRKYQEAMKIAPNKEELKLLLSAVGEARSLEAFQLASGYLNDELLQKEAEAAVVNIAERIAGNAGPAITADAKKIAQSSKNDALVRRARGVVEIIERIEDYITSWEIAGPYAKENVNLFAEAFAPEGADASSVHWKPFQSMTDPNRLWRLEFDKIIGGDLKVVYVRTNVWSPKECKAQLEVGSDGGLKVWLNGELIHAKEAARTVTPGEDVVPAVLKQGWNSLMMKINNGGGDWGACARFRTPEGEKPEGLRNSVNKN